MKIRFDVNSVDYTKFKKSLKQLLLTKVEIDDAVVEEQITLIIQKVIDFNPIKIAQRYKREVRNNNRSFFSVMKTLVLAKANFIDNTTSYIKVPMVTAKGVKEVKFDIPVSRMGSKHLAEAMLDFLYKYYEDNPPFKYIKGLDRSIDDDFIIKQAAKYDEGKYLNEDIIPDSEELSFVLLILSVIRDFPQFPKPQRGNSILTESEGHFLVGFRKLINYRDWKKGGYGIIKPNFINTNIGEMKTKSLTNDIKTLRNDIRAYISNCTNALDSV